MPYRLGNGMRIHYLEWGDQQAQPVVLIHGIQGCAAIWSEVAEALAQAGYRVIAPDLRWHGQTSPDSASSNVVISSPTGYPPHTPVTEKTRPYTVTAYAQDVITLIEQLSLGSVHLVGHSLGATIAWEVATARQDLVDRLVIEDQHPCARDGNLSYWLDWAKSWQGSFSSYEEGIAYLHQIGRNPAWWGPSLTEKADGSWGWAFDVQALVETARQMHQQDEWDRLARIQAPVLLIRGECSTHLAADTADQMVKTIPDAVLVTIAGEDHWVHRHAHPYVDVVIDFFSSASVTKLALTLEAEQDKP
ncbi:alpha/beta fold hydrolase [Brevibacillus dissolubilis]|uniref:alpha/beta fold hydrolase n=1 Tax=Brevibacillus dissolubilis TaxID=1844116 RepID=UPI0011166AC0|nr:alpha/beta hydrolase [Brevibacillus dissolubilis]